MDDAPSPYQAPASTPPPVPAPQGVPPAAVKVFGIIHLILAGLGILTGLWGFVSMKFTEMLQGLNPRNSAAAASQMKYMEELWWVTVMSSLFTLGLAVLLIISGMKLVRLQPDGIPWSNRYAWASIVTKGIMLVVTVAYVLPVTNRMMDDMLGQGMSGGAADKMGGVMKTITAVSSVASPVVSCIYPILALFFLSRPNVKAWARA